MRKQIKSKHIRRLAAALLRARLPSRWAVYMGIYPHSDGVWVGHMMEFPSACRAAEYALRSDCAMTHILFRHMASGDIVWPPEKIGGSVYPAHAPEAMYIPASC